MDTAVNVCGHIKDQTMIQHLHRSLGNKPARKETLPAMTKPKSTTPKRRNTRGLDPIKELALQYAEGSINEGEFRQKMTVLETIGI